MNPDFWHNRWNKNEIGFHEQSGNVLLRRFCERLQLPKQAKVFVPLCGKTRDIAWLLSHGIQVVAIELNQSAVDALFAELGFAPQVQNIQADNAELLQHSVPGLDVFVGDFFALTSELVGHIDACYDRGALVAMPNDMRSKYSDHLLSITQACQQLLICYDYEQSLFKGPPFSVTSQELQQKYGAIFNIETLCRERVEGGFRGHDEVFEAAYLLSVLDQ